MGKTKAERLAELELRSRAMLNFDAQFGLNVSGLDEVGRGSIFGPVFVCLANVNWSEDLIEVYDSKTLSEKKRAYLYHKLMERVNYYGIASEDNTYIDERGINPAIKKAMEEAARAADKMARTKSMELGFVLVDEVAFDLDGFHYQKFKGGDRQSFQVAAASIIAKYSRDEYIKSLAELYPHYDLENNMGYGTKRHTEGIKKYGLSPLHRRSFCRGRE